MMANLEYDPETIDPQNPIIQLCIAGTQAEFQGQVAQARELYLQAWQLAGDDYEACIAAHYLARFQDNPAETLRWNRAALRRAEAVEYERVASFYPSQYLNMGHSHELLGEQAEAEKYYALAAALGVVHQGP